MNTVSQDSSVQQTLTGAYTVLVPGQDSDSNPGGLGLWSGPRQGGSWGNRKSLVPGLWKGALDEQEVGHRLEWLRKDKGCKSGQEQGGEVCWSDQGDGGPGCDIQTQFQRL